MTRWSQNTLFDPLFRFAETFDCSPEEICAAVGVDLDKATTPGALVPAAQVIDAVEWCAQRSGYASFGLLLARRLDYRIFGVAALRSEGANSLEHYYGILREHLPLQSGGYSFEFAREGAGAAARFLLHVRGAFPARHYVEGALALITHYFERLMGQGWAPLRMDFAHERLGALSDYEAAFHAPVVFSASRNAILFSADDLRWRSHAPHDSDRQRTDTEARDLGLIAAFDHVVHTEQIIRALLPGPAGLQEVAAELGVSTRSLQRRLREAGTNFSQVLATTRTDLAREYLRQPGVTVTYVASRLGFSHVSVLTRLLRRELGASPSALKARRRAVQ